jgi:peptidoglycan/xylan/chitin deacetylase (PgdA/CDA1 family)
MVLAPVRRALAVEVRTGAEHVALTFDDGPHPEGTPQVLEQLRAAAVPAVFFLVGEQVERHPELARAVVDAGHQVGVHCQRHRNLARLAPAQVRRDLEQASAVIAATIGFEPSLYRPPYGVLTAPALLHARRRGWRTVLWRRDGRDWRADATAGSIAARLTGRARAGDVLLLHDADHYSAPGSWRATADALEPVLDVLAARGLRLGLL